MQDTLCEKIGVRKIKLLRPGVGTMAVAGSFVNADSFLMAWRSASRGWLKCKFEIEYQDESVVKGEYRLLRGKEQRVSLSTHVRSSFRKMLSRNDLAADPDIIVDDMEIELWLGSRSLQFNVDFLDCYETEDFSSK